MELTLRRGVVKATVLSSVKSIIESSPVPSTRLPWAIKAACSMWRGPRKAKYFFWPNKSGSWVVAVILGLKYLGFDKYDYYIKS